ncbi:MAG TPA: PilZ domain-containing protein [Myxococcota bacterium]|nr:PilZ domain-containing protein [Myxococcota bacterium]
MTASSPAVLLLDDGELGEARVLLEELGADFIHLRGQSGPAPLPLPRVLLIASARRAQALAQERTAPRPRSGSPLHPWDAAAQGRGEARRPVAMVIASEDSPTLRSMLREGGFDVLLRKPVHPTVLRLLVLRALYQGPEKRREERLALGESVVYRAGPLAREAILADLSRAGCRLISRYGARRGMRIAVELPSGDGAPLLVEGHVLRSTSAREGAHEREVAIGVAFEALSPASRERLEAMVRRRTEAARPPGSREESEEPGAQQNERRRHPRGAYARRVQVLEEEASRVLMGRDLSVSGMRIDPHPGLEIGADLRLAVYAGAREEPLLLRGQVVRAGVEGAVALRFEGVSDEAARRLEALVAALPPVESLDDGEAGSLGAVVAEILPG